VVTEVQVVCARIIEVDGALDKTQAENVAIEGDVRGWLLGEGRHMVDSTDERHKRAPQRVMETRG
jgi:hypothetical protein